MSQNCKQCVDEVDSELLLWAEMGSISTEIGLGRVRDWVGIAYPDFGIGSGWPTPTYNISEANQEKLRTILILPDFWA